jgi:DNA-binding transcriptional MerR regulator
VSTYTIGEVAERSGFSASALRYYEGIGLVTPSARTDAGYRVYDDQALSRLAFIQRAKQLGCSLEEITDLVGVWDGERCGPVQRRFHALVTTKIADAQQQIGELSALTSQLQNAARQLRSLPVDGPCNDTCACLGGAANEPAIACTLEAEARPERLTEWQAVLDQATSRRMTGVASARLEFDDGVELDELTRLVTLEQQCCSFFSFSITVDQRGIGLEVSAPADASDIVGSLFASPA